MPLDILGSYAASSSTGAIARNAARSSDASASATIGFAGLSARGGTSGAEEYEASSSGNMAVFLSPFIRLDIKTRLAIVEIRNSETGEVQQQYPSPRAVREYAQNLPDDSDLRVAATDNGGQSDGGDAAFAPRIICSAADNAAEAAKAPVVTFGQGSASSSSPAPAPSPVPSGIAKTAAAAFGSFQNVLTGGRELAVA